MKKKIALMLSLIIMLSVLIPVKPLAESLAQEDSGLEKAIKIARERFAIPTNYEFNYRMGTEGNGKKIWYLDWNSKDSDRKNINVSIREDGTVLRYHYYKPSSYDGQKKFPKVSRSEAREMAKDFIKKVNPDIASKLRYDDGNIVELEDYRHFFYFIRIENGIPCYDNTVRVTIDSDSGEVISYYYNLSEDVNFPKPDNIISLEEAEKAYEDKLGLNLIYKYAVDDEKIRIYPVYTLQYSKSEYALDAFTGEKVDLNDRAEVYESMEKVAADEAGNGSQELTDEELEAVKENLEKLLSEDEAESIARNFDTLALDGSYELRYSSLSSDWPDKENFIWNLNFQKKDKEDSDSRNVGITIDAVTGEIKSFNVYTPYEGDKKAQYDFDQAKAEVEKFLKEFKPEKFVETKYMDIYNKDYSTIKTGDTPYYYEFNYTRMVNGIPFPGNGLSIEFNAVSGQITRFTMDWFNTEFPALDNTIDLNKAHTELFDQIGLELQYVLKKAHYSGDERPEALLVYNIKSGKPANFDAYTGNILDYRGREYKEIEIPEYTDIHDSFAKKQITALAEYGIYLEGTEFKPDEYIIQKDFFTLLSKVLKNYYGPIINLSSSEKEIDEMYDRLIRVGIVKAEEKAPYSKISRQDSVKYIIRTLGYDKVADIKGIYKTVFNDEDDINPDLIGYIAIAKGLNIISGIDGCFYPTKNLTRAEAAVLIYNYLSR